MKKIILLLFLGSVALLNAQSFVGGNIITTEHMGSYIFTEQTLNELQVKDPDLFNNLESQKYHIIRKETESGAVKQDVIFKF